MIAVVVAHHLNELQQIPQKVQQHLISTSSKIRIPTINGIFLFIVKNIQNIFF